MTIKGKNVIITGGAKGIGRHIAHTFADAGANVAIADIDPVRLDQTADELSSRDIRVMAENVDVRDESAAKALMDKVHGSFGSIDVLVNNAAIVPHLAWKVHTWPRIRDMDREFWDRVVDTNLTGTFLCTKYALPYMEAQRSGHVINLYGGGGSVGSTVYVVTKEALRGFTKLLAVEEKEFGVVVVILSPGAAIATEDAPEEARQRMPGPEYAGNRFVLAAEVGMELTGECLTPVDGKLVIEA